MSNPEAPLVQLTELGTSLSQDRDGSLRISLRKQIDDLEVQARSLTQQNSTPDDFARAAALHRAVKAGQEIIERISD